jgi:pimeloyl-ACP methyl ester carboxylesterase
MSVYVLVHGGWHGGWCWRRVTPLLQKEGHTVYTPTLTGLGERSHLLSPEIGLDTHIQDVLGLLQWEDLSGVVMVGHSYAGAVISGVAEAVPQQLAHLVYLDAFVLRDGECVLDVTPRSFREGLERTAEEAGDGWRIPPVGATYGITNASDIAWLHSKVTAHPLKSLTDPLRVSNPSAEALHKTFIACGDKPATSPFAESVARTRDTAGWSYEMIPTGHDAMITTPPELAARLLRVGS